MVTDGQLDSGCDVCVIDPPRKGVEDLTLNKLCSKTDGRLKTIVYVSCGFDAFQRDAKRLVEEGGYTITKAEGHVLFPGSDAIETLAIFERP